MTLALFMAPHWQDEALRRSRGARLRTEPQLSDPGAQFRQHPGDDHMSAQASASHTPASNLLSLTAGAAIIAILASFTLASRLAYASALAPQDLMAIRFVTSGLLLLPVALSRGASGLLTLDSAKLALTGGLGFATLAFAGLMLVPASHAGALLHGALPLFTFTLGLVLGRTTADRGRVAGAFLVVIALSIIAWDNMRGTGWQQLLGCALLLTASATWSAFGILAARLKPDPISTAATVSVLSAAVYLPLYVAFLESSLDEAPLSPVLIQVAVQGVLVGTISVFAYSWAISKIGALGAAVATAMVPSVTALTAMPLLSEFPSPTVATGLAILVAGSLLVLPVRFQERRNG
ncbi:MULTISPECIES: DMT family transporter [Roseomonadaceae]|uniref:DMT family transporter n=1 Tax=Falsiroseomonas oleicola TaxID=2801474 RepID=A0ABS6HBL9_9PROT|nr:DMT family transporter [Roseomonas oleicola]MBU8546114.1 DMT family transporter [Roseomonas oleicola]